MGDLGLDEVEQYLAKNRDTSQYDPHQSEEDRRDLRVQYRSLTGDMLENRRDLIVQDNGEKLQETLQKGNKLFEKVKNPQEAVLDSRFLSASAEINAQKAKNIRIGEENEMNIDEFVSKVITASKDGTKHEDDVCLDWEYIGKRASTFGKRAHTMDFLLGPLEIERKQVKRGKVTRLVKNKEDLVVPAKLQQGDIQKQENETSNNVNNIYKILSGVGPVNYFKFVTNPESFSQTVENIFYVSFLSRTGVVGIDVTSGQPILTIRNAPNVESLDDIVSKKQIIMGIDIKDYNDIISTYNITTSYIPTRQRKETVTPGSGWY